MAKIKNDYFELIAQQTEHCVQAANMLAEMLENYNPETISEMREKIHAVEHNADKIHHDIISRLSTEFITPIDQEDILRLVQIIDDVTDALDEVVLDFYMYDIKVLPEGADKFALLVSKCVNALYNATLELKNFKKPQKLRALLIEVNTFEGEADEAFTEAIHHIFSHSADAKTLIGSNSIYKSLEKCCDLCEHASDVIEQVIIKNT